MKRRQFNGLLICAAGAVAAPRVAAVGPGAVAPRFVLPTGDGSTIDLDSLRDRFVYVDFWASWCAPCRLSFPWMNRMAERWPSLAVVAINVDKRREDAERFLRNTPARFPVAFDPDGRTPALYAVSTMPSAYLLAPGSRVQWIHRGFRERDIPLLEAALQQALEMR